MKKQALEALWSQLNALPVKGEGDAAEVPDDDVVSVLNAAAHPVYQSIFNKGHSTATGKGKPDIDRLTAEVAQKQTEIERLTGELETLKQAQPEAAKLHEQYGTQIKELKEKHTAQLNELKGARKADARERARSDLKALLTGKFKIDPDYADVIVQKAEVGDRIRVNDDNGIEVLQQAGSDIPLAPGEGGNALELLATELRRTAPAKFVLSDADSGSDVRGGGAGGGGTGKGTVFDKIREDVTKERQQENTRGGMPSGLQRLRGVRPAATTTTE